jgi:hypothetical protein
LSICLLFVYFHFYAVIELEVQSLFHNYTALLHQQTPFIHILTAKKYVLIWTLFDLEGQNPEGGLGGFKHAGTLSDPPSVRGVVIVAPDLP